MTTSISPEVRYTRQLARFAQHAIAAGYTGASSIHSDSHGPMTAVKYTQPEDARRYGDHTVVVYFDGDNGNVLLATASTGEIVENGSTSSREARALDLFVPLDPTDEDTAATTAMFDEHVTAPVGLVTAAAVTDFPYCSVDDPADEPIPYTLAELADRETDGASTDTWSATDLARTTALLDLIEGYETEVANTRRRTNFELGQMMAAQRFATELRAFGVDHGILDPADGPSDTDREAL